MLGAFSNRVMVGVFNADVGMGLSGGVGKRC